MSSVYIEVAMHHQIDSLVYLNRLRYLPTKEKLLFTLMLFALSYFSGNVVQLVITIWLLIWVVVYAGIPWGFYSKLLLIPLGFWLMSIPAIALEIVWLNNPNSVYPEVGQGVRLGFVYLYLSQQGLIEGGELLVRALSLTSCMYFLLLTTPLMEILQVLENLGFPSLVLELLALMYRFINILTETTSELILAQQSRSGYNRPSRVMASLGLLISQLLHHSLENYRQVVLGLNSRGFIGKLSFWQPNLHKSNPRYTLEAIVGYSCLVLYNLIV